MIWVVPRFASSSKRDWHLWGETKPLNYRFENDEYWAGLAIPNQEVKIVYGGMFRNWLYLAAPSHAYIDDLVVALFSGDAPTIQEILEEMFLRILSYQDGGGRKWQTSVGQDGGRIARGNGASLTRVITRHFFGNAQ